MNLSTIETQIKKIIVDLLGVTEDEVQPSAHLSDDLGADELNHVELIQAVEEAFSITINDEEAEKIERVEELMHCTRQQLGV